MYSVFYFLRNPDSFFVPLEELLTFLVFQYVFIQSSRLSNLHSLAVDLILQLQNAAFFMYKVIIQSC